QVELAPQAYQPEPAPYQQPTYDPYAGQPAPQTYQQPAYDPNAGQPRRRPTSSRLTTRMPASPRRSRISRSQRRISRKARQFPHRSQSPRSCRRK
ncbi:hypothetical protein CQA15_27110, partial [Klebsiella pneumoniae]